MTSAPFVSAALDSEARLETGARTMRAAVYRGQGRVFVESLPVPEIGPGELLVRVRVCGICNTDLKKIHDDLLPPPRIFGHETAGIVAATGRGVKDFREGDRVAVFHHIPCLECYFCRAGAYAQCPTYKKVGVTAGFEPSGGGFAEYIRVMDWVVARGVVKVPDEVSFEEASFVEPVNTCLKAVRQAELKPQESVLIEGQGPIGLLLLMLARRAGCAVFVSDLLEERLKRASQLGAQAALNPREVEVARTLRALTSGRGVDAVLVAAPGSGLVSQAIEAVRPGGRVLLFAQTSPKDRLELAARSVCVEEKRILGSYSASVDLQEESARLVFERQLPVAGLVTHRFPLERIEEAIALAAHPQPGSLKIVVGQDQGSAG